MTDANNANSKTTCVEAVSVQYGQVCIGSYCRLLFPPNVFDHELFVAG